MSANLSCEQDHWERFRDRTLKYPRIPGIRTGRGSDMSIVYPFELCHVPEGQTYNRKVPPEYMDKMLKFSTAPPKARLQEIMKGHKVCNV